MTGVPSSEASKCLVSINFNIDIVLLQGFFNADCFNDESRLNLTVNSELGNERCFSMPKALIEEMIENVCS